MLTKTQQRTRTALAPLALSAFELAETLRKTSQRSRDPRPSVIVLRAAGCRLAVAAIEFGTRVQRFLDQEAIAGAGPKRPRKPSGSRDRRAASAGRRAKAL